MKEFKARASSAVKLMTAPRNKSEVLSETTKSYIKEWLIEQIYGFRKEIKSKYWISYEELKNKKESRHKTEILYNY